MTRVNVVGVLIVLCAAMSLGHDTLLAANRVPFSQKTEGVGGSSHRSVCGNDSDEDGLPDWWEEQHFGNLDQGPGDDPDDDSLPNLAEYLLGTDPNSGNTGGGDVCNHPPALTVTASASSVSEDEGLAVLAEAVDVERDRVRFAVTDTLMCTSGDCLDPPEFFADPVRPFANFYWVPAVGRAGESHGVTFYACDDQDACSYSQLVKFNVTPAPGVEIIDEHEIVVSTNSLSEGEALTISGINTSPPPSDDDVQLKVEFDPPLGSGADAPRVYKLTSDDDERFGIKWTPNNTRSAAGPYTIKLIPHYQKRRCQEDNEYYIKCIEVTDKLVVTFPQDRVTINTTETDTFEFDVEWAEYSGGTVTCNPPLKQPAGSTFNTNGCSFTWTPDVNSAGIVGGYHVLQLDLHAGGDTANPEILLGVNTNGNLLLNPSVEFDTDSNGVPDGWFKLGENVAQGHILSWVVDEDPERNYVLKSERTSTNGLDPDWFGWAQNMYLTPSSEQQLPEDTIYEFECTYRVENVLLDLDSNGIALKTHGLGVMVQFYGQSGERIHPAYTNSLLSYESGFDQWSDADGCYHHVGTNGHSDVDTNGVPYWKTHRLYLKPPRGTRYAQVRTLTRVRGGAYYDYFSLREVDKDEHVPQFAKSGTVTLMPLPGREAHFLIEGGATPPWDYGDTFMTRADLREYGFNCMVFNEGVANKHRESGMYATGHVMQVPYLRASGTEGFDINTNSYCGLEQNMERAEQLADAQNEGLEGVMLLGVDESNYGVSQCGAPLKLRELNFAKQKIKKIIDRPYKLNLNARDWDLAMDEPHARLADVIHFTWNCPTAYSNATNGYSNNHEKKAAKMCRVGQYIRRWLKTTAEFNNDVPKPVFAFGFGTYWWAYWDGRYIHDWHLDQFVPFHLQRFQIYNQIVNGACGITFFDFWRVHLDDIHCRYSWDQIVQIVGEISALEEVCSIRDFDDIWDSDKYIEAMLKKHNGRIYLIATNPSEDVLGQVTITINASGILGGVTALFENQDTSNEYPMIRPGDGVIDSADAAQVRRRGVTRLGWKRAVPINGDGMSFTDTFIDYAVHVYEIEGPDADGNSLSDWWEVLYFGVSGTATPDGDPDDDGLINSAEYDHGSDPTDEDTDDDGLNDGDEVNIHGTDPTKFDTDGDRISDQEDNCPTDNNGGQEDTDGDGVGDACDVVSGTGNDCNLNDIPDECDIASFTSYDCNSNGIPDECDIAGGTSYDCNSNGIPDECDIVAVRMPFTNSQPLNNNATTDLGADHSPQLTTDRAGNWVAVWYSNDSLDGTIGTDRDILMARSSDNGETWTDPEPLNNNAAADSGQDRSSQVTNDGVGHWVVVWQSNDSLGGTIGTDYDILIARSGDKGKTWTDPEPLNNNATADSLGNQSPQVTTDGAGHWVAVWDSYDSLSGTIGIDCDILVASSNDNGETWTFPQPLNNNAFTDSGSDCWPQITTDCAGNWAAVWRSSDSLGGTIGTDYDILVARSSNNGETWTDPLPLNGNATTDSGGDYSPQVTTDEAGNWVAVWRSNDSLGETIGTDYDILIVLSIDNGETWTDPEPLNNATTDSGGDYDPQVATDCTGNWAAVWRSDDDLGETIGTDYDILVVRSGDNGFTWTDPEPLNSNAITDSDADRWPQMATDGAGNWATVWNSDNSLSGTIGTDGDILVARTFTADCNINGILDECDIAEGSSQDCQPNSIPDECDIAAGTSLDCNNNDIPDECDTIEAGDFDDDDDVDLDDFHGFQDCFAGPGFRPEPTLPNCINACLAAFDFEPDGDIDLDDYAAFQVVFTGSLDP